MSIILYHDVEWSRLMENVPSTFDIKSKKKKKKKKVLNFNRQSLLSVHCQIVFCIEYICT